MSDEFDDEAMDWKDYDPFSKLGQVRVIVVKRNPETNWRGELDNCIDIVAVDGFYDGFMCSPINKDYSRKSVLPTYREDVETCEHKINHIFKTMKNGLYELVGEMWAWSSQSYEGDWDGDTEVRNFKIQEISFDDAIHFCEEDAGLYDGLVKLKISKKNEEGRLAREYNYRFDIHYYMTKQQILRNQANALSHIVERHNYYGSRANFDTSKAEELEACIHLMMLELDSETKKFSDEDRELAKEIDKEVFSCMEAHDHLMKQEES